MKFKPGDKVMIRLGEHSTWGGDLFHRETEWLKANRIILTIRTYATLNGNSYHMKCHPNITEDWEWNARDLELASLENE